MTQSILANNASVYFDDVRPFSEVPKLEAAQTQICYRALTGWDFGHDAGHQTFCYIPSASGASGLDYLRQ